MASSSSFRSPAHNSHTRRAREVRIHAGGGDVDDLGGGRGEMRAWQDKTVDKGCVVRAGESAGGWSGSGLLVGFSGGRAGKFGGVGIGGYLGNDLSLGGNLVAGTVVARVPG